MPDEATLTVDFAFLFGLSFFLGFAFEDIYQRAGVSRPGGVRTFPMLALMGGGLYLFDPAHLIPFTAGLVIVGAWLTVYYREHCRETDETGQQNVGLMVPLLNVYAYLLGAIAVALPHWVAVGTTVAAVLLFTARARLHELARSIEVKEFVTAAQFLILTGLVLPLLPDTAVTTLTSITPRQVWLALVVVCGLSYASYLLQRYAAPATEGLWMAALGGLYSSTATTVVLARQMKAGGSTTRQAQAGITLATAIMYLRILVVVAVFNQLLAHVLAGPLIALLVLGLLIAAAQYRYGPRDPEPKQPVAANRNPLELGPAIIFVAMFVAISLISSWIRGHFGTAGIYSLAAVVGVTDIDPFVLNLAEGGARGLSSGALAGAILVATCSNNVLKAAYATGFAGRRASFPSVAALLVLTLAGLAIALAMVHLI